MTASRVGVNTMSFMWNASAHAALDALGTKGYRVFEVMTQHPHFDPFMEPAQVREFASFLRAGGYEVETLNVPSLDLNLASGTAPMREYTVSVFERLIRIAAEIGAKGVIVVTGRVNPLIQPSRVDLEGWFRGSFERVLRAAESHGVELLLENIPMGVYPDAPGLVRFAASLDHPLVRICYDIANAHFIGEDAAKGLELVAPHLAIVHLSDTRRDAWRHDPVGQGDCDFAGFCATLDRIGYAGTAILEIISPQPLVDIPASHARLGAWLPA